MEIYYIRYRSDDPGEEGIWLDSDSQFFSRKEAADDACRIMNNERFANYNIQRQQELERWEKREAAFVALSTTDFIDSYEIFPYHKRQFSYEAFCPIYIVDSIKVDE